jgi:hypothetical protein
VDQNRFDTLTRALTSVPTRRHLLRGIMRAGAGAFAAAALATVDPRTSEEAEARKRRKRRKRRKPCGRGGPCRVFVTSTQYGGNLGGLTGADAICQDLATTQGLPGTYQAWLSDSTASPSTRFVRSPGPYRLVDGTRIADNWTDLTDGSLAAPINLTQAGNAVADSDKVWTHTQTDGTARGGANHCGNWGGATGDGDVGAHALRNASWTDSDAEACNTGQHLYCFQQS